MYPLQLWLGPYGGLTTTTRAQQQRSEAVNRMPLEPSWGDDGDALILKELGAMFDTANLADAAVRRAHADDPNFSLIIPQLYKSRCAKFRVICVDGAVFELVIAGTVPRMRPLSKLTATLAFGPDADN